MKQIYMAGFSGYLDTGQVEDQNRTKGKLTNRKTL